MASPRVLIVEDEAAVRLGLREFLAVRGFDVSESTSCETALASFRVVRPDVIVLDYSLPDGNALDLLPQIKTLDPGATVVILTGHGSIELAVRAMQLGAEQFLTKPVQLDALATLLERLVENQRNRRNQEAQRVARSKRMVDPFLGKSAAIQRLVADAQRVLQSDSPVLLLGETGTGKSLVAYWLHTHGPRAREAMVSVSCAGIAREHLENELFGHREGAFAGATSTKAGLLEVAHHGTLFLDEIGDMHPEVQVKLLTVLDEKRFRRLGDVEECLVDVRVVAATHQDLPAMIKAGRFRQDLYYRVSTLPLTVPPLRERTEDILVIARQVLADLAAELGRPAPNVSAAAEQALVSYPWPGNIRELRNVLERAMLLSAVADELQPADLRLPTGGSATLASIGDLDLTLEQLERRHIERILDAERGHVGRAAARLGVPRSTLYQMLARLGIKR